MNKGRNPSVEIAENFIISHIGEGHFQGKQWLPSIKKLSAMADVSLVTMWKAVNNLKEKGVLSGGRNKRITVAGAGSEGDADQNYSGDENYKWHRAKQEILRDILNRVYRRGAYLPTLKEMQATYRISASTLKKALSALVEEQHIVIAHTRYLVPEVSTGKSKNSICFVTLVRKENTQEFSGVFNVEIARIIALECSRLNINMHIVAYQSVDSPQLRDYSTGRTISIEEYKDVLGFVVSIPWMWPGGDRILRTLSHVKKPIAIIDQVGGWNLPSYLETRSFVQMFTMSLQKEPAEHVAQFLIGTGHQHIAFISPFNRLAWSNKRGEALRDFYSQAGSGYSVSSFTDDTISAAHELQHDGARRCNLDRLIAAYDKWAQNAPTVFQSFFGEYIPQLLYSNSGFAESYLHIEQHMKKAIKDKRITAWVAANDLTARIIMHFLQKHKISVPEKLSLISFDDGDIALRNRITSYNFNVEAYVNSALEYVIRPMFWAQTWKGKTSHIAGTIVERDSTAPV